MAILFLEGGDTPSKNEPKKQATLPLPAVTAAAAVPSFGAQEAYLPSGVQPYTAQNGFTHLPLPLPLPAETATAEVPAELSTATQEAFLPEGLQLYTKPDSYVPPPLPSKETLQNATFQPLRYNWADIGSMARNANLLQGDIFGTAPLKNAATKFFESTINTNKVSINGEGPVYMSSLQGMNNRQFDIYYNLLQETMNAEKERLASITAADFQNTDKLPHASNASVADELTQMLPWKKYGWIAAKTDINNKNQERALESILSDVFGSDQTHAEKIEESMNNREYDIKALQEKFDYTDEEMSRLISENEKTSKIFNTSMNLGSNFFPLWASGLWSMASFPKKRYDVEKEMVAQGASEEEIDDALWAVLARELYKIPTAALSPKVTVPLELWEALGWAYPEKLDGLLAFLVSTSEPEEIEKTIEYFQTKLQQDTLGLTNEEKLILEFLKRME